jgi:transposase
MTRTRVPEKHIVDTGYLDAELLVTSLRDYKINLLGPTRPNYRWQAQEATGFEAKHFQIDWERKQVTCPRERTSVRWEPYIDRSDNEVVHIMFSQTDCLACSSRHQCTHGVARMVAVRQQAHYEALQAAREREATDEYKAEYRKRAGIEGTVSQAVRAFGLRRARYIGHAKTLLQHVITAVAINLMRISNWLTDVPLAQTRRSVFARLMTQPASG